MKEKKYTHTELEQAMSKILAPLIAEIKDQKAAIASLIKPEEEFMDADQLAFYLHRSIATVYRWSSEGTGPKQCGAYLWRKADVEEWLKEPRNRTSRNCRKHKEQQQAISEDSPLGRAMRKKAKTDAKKAA
jgi:predicted DNA-binding transcriptional regulator AlpA